MIWLWVGLGLVLFVFLGTALVGAPYVPTKPRDAARAFEDLYPLTERDVLVDIGSGDGMVLRAAARRGARAVGYEINPFLVWVSRWLSRKQAGVSVRLANFWTTDLPEDTTVVYTFGESRDIKRMARKVQDEATRIGHPIYLISYAFEVPGLTPVKQTSLHFLYRFEPLQTGNRKYNE